MVIFYFKNINKYLVHACLEGPEAGVYYRGTARINLGFMSVDIYLADYVGKLATEFTVYVSPIIENLSSSEYIIPTLGTTGVKAGKFTVYSNVSPCEFNYLVFGKRQSIETEPMKELTWVKGEKDSPYKWI